METLNKDKIKSAVTACRAPFATSMISIIKDLTTDEVTVLEIVLELTAAPVVVTPARGRPTGSRNRKKAETPGETK